MSRELAFWILMLFWLVTSGLASYRPEKPWFGYAGSALLFVLFLLLGWKVFGPPIH